MDQRDAQLALIQWSMKTRGSRSKVLKCPYDLFSYLSGLREIDGHQITIRTRPEEFQGYVMQEDDHLYLVDTRRSKEVAGLICSAKNWFYYGYRFETSAHMAFLGGHYDEGRFMEGQKLGGMMQDLGADAETLDHILRMAKLEKK